MQLKLLDIDQFIQLKKLKVVSSSAIPSKNYDAAGLWSETIFGRIGSENRKRYFGYVELRGKLIHPTAYAMIKTVSPVISSILNEKQTYVFKDGKFVVDEYGDTGLGLLIQHFYDIKFIDIAKPDRLEVAKFIDDNKEKLLIDKWIVMPAAIRDIDISRPGARTVAEINTYYRSLLYLSGLISGDAVMDNLVSTKMQRTLLDIVKWIQSNMKGKQGLFRNNLLKKTVDFSTRLVLSSSPDIKLGYIGVPWHVLVSIYEPLFTYRVKASHIDFEKDILSFMKVDSDGAVDARMMTKFVTKVNAHPDQVSTLMQHQIKEIIAEFLDDQVVIAKRDPAISRNSWFSAKPVMIDKGVVEVNSLDLGPITGDSDGDTLQVCPLFADETKKTATEKMNPRYSKSKWADTSHNGNITYNFSLDTTAMIFSATEV